MIISTPEEISRFQDLLGSGDNFGISLSYADEPNPDGLAQAFIIAEYFLNGQSAALILGDNMFYGYDRLYDIDATKTNNELGYLPKESFAKDIKKQLFGT